MKNEHFVTGSVKILDGRENEHRLTEIVQCKLLKKRNEDDEENETPLTVERHFAEPILPKRRKRGMNRNTSTVASCYRLPIFLL